MAEITEKIIEIKTKVEGEKTVKELKEQIAELTKLMDSLDKESYEYHSTVDMLVEAEEELTTMMKVGKSQLSAQEGSYNALVNRMAALKKAHKAVTDEMTRNRLSDEINSINEQLKEMDANNGVYVRNVGNYENAIEQALKTPQQELKALRLQLAQLTEGTDEYNAVFTRMAQLTHDVTEQQEQLKWASSDLGDMLGNVAGIATSLAGGFSAFNALTGLLGGGESEELEKAMLQAQRFIQLIQGLEQLEQLGDKIGGLWKGIKNFSDNTQTAAITLTNFNKKTETANATMANAANATFTTATATAQAAESTGKLANSQKELNQTEIAYIENLQELLIHHREMLAEEQQELNILNQKLTLETELDERTRLKIDETKKEIYYHEEKIKQYDKGISSIRTDTAATQANTTATVSNTTANDLNHKGLKRWLATKILASKANKSSIAEINAMTTAQLIGNAATVAWSGALTVLKTVLVSTGIGALIVALGSLVSLLGKGLGSLWSWISGAKEAAEATKKLSDEVEHLNNMLGIEERFWSRREALLKAQGATEEELYQEERKAIEAKLKRVQALLAENEAIAANIGAKKLQKDRYEEFRETLEGLREQEKELRIELEDFDWDNYCDKIAKARKENEKRAEEQKKAAEKAKEAHDKERESADKLYKELIEYYKDEKVKLREKYEEEKSLLEKFGKDTTNLTKKYEEDKTKIVLKEEEERRKLREQFNKDFDAQFRNPSLEYFNNQLENARAKLEDFKNVDVTINVDEQGFMSAINFDDNIKYLNDVYGLSIQNMEHFKLVYKKVKMELEDAEKDLVDYQNKLALDKVAAIEKEIEAKRGLVEFDAVINEKYEELSDDYTSRLVEKWNADDAVFKKRKALLEEEITMYYNTADSVGDCEEAKTEAIKKASEKEMELRQMTSDYTISQYQRRIDAINELLDFETEVRQKEYELEISKHSWLDSIGNNYITQMKLRWEAEDAIYNKRKEQIENEIELYKSLANDTRISEDARLDALRSAAELERQLQLESTEHTIAQNERKKEATENYVTAVQDSIDGISSILSNVASAWETTIKAQVEAGEISEDEGERQLEEMKDLQSAMALVNTLSSAVSAFNSLASIPFVGTALGTAAAAAALASGLAQVAAINKVKKGDKTASSDRYTEVTPTVPNDYTPQAVTNVTGGREQEDFANALSQTNLWVSVKDIDSAQGRVKTRDKETSF